MPFMESGDRSTAAEANGSGTPAAMSQCAIAGFATGLLGLVVPCCPVIPVVAMVLGWVARGRIRRDPNLGGGRLALAAMLLGGAGMLLQGLVIDWFTNRFRETVELRSEAAIDALMRSATEADAEGVQANWGESSSVAEVLELGGIARDRYGWFRGISVVGWTYGGGFAEPDVEAAVIWNFEGRDLTGSFRMRLVPGTTISDPFPTPMPIELLIADDREGPLQVPGASTAPAAPNAEGASEGG